MKLFDAFKKAKELIGESEFVNVYKTVCDEKEYRIIIAKKYANKHTIIHFIDNTICWEQIPFFRWGSVYLFGQGRIPIYRFEGKVLNTLFVVKGMPGGDEGLDNGIFRSPKRYDENFVNCMTYKKFKKM